MIRLIQRRLIIPRGDTGTFTIPVVASKNTGDVAVFTIFSEMTKKKIYEKIVAIDSDTITVEFAHGDTVNLPVGKYVWDIKFYKNPVFLDDVLVNGDEIDSYYAAFTLPVCEIRQTGDTLLTADDAPTATIAPEYLNIVNAAISETLYNKSLAAESAAAAETSAANASTYLADTLTAKEAAEARVNEIENLSVEVNTGAEGSNASVSYTPATGVLSFEIPRGDTGNGIASCVLNADFTLTINYTDGTSLTTVPIRGDTPHLTIGEVTEGPNAIATITGTDANPILNLTLPNANVPTRVSELENDAGYLTEHQDLSDYIQKTDYATPNSVGVVKINPNVGITASGPTILINPATETEIKEGTNAFKPISPLRQQVSTFYSLAKAAGDTTQSQSSNAVGIYTNEAKSAIQQMLDVPSTSAVTSEIATAIGSINSFDMTVVQALPTQDISTHTIYLVPKTGETNDVYDEYVYINNAWEMVGNTQVDLSNYALKSELPEVPVQDIQVNGTSILENGVANVPIVGNEVNRVGKTVGMVRFKDGYCYGFQTFLSGNDYCLAIKAASESGIKTGKVQNANGYGVIDSTNVNAATFYGLAKAAGDTTQSQSNNVVGQYTDEAKAAIQTMLGVPSTSDMAAYATKADTVLNTTLSLGRLANSEVGENSVALGDNVTASGPYSFATGSETVASSDSAYAEGEGTQATDSAAHAEGTYTQATGYASHAEGDNTIAEGYFSHAEGTETTATGMATHVFGERNFNCNESAETNERGTMVEIVGNGQDDTYSNARALTWTGDEYLAGNLYVNANSTSTSGTRVATVAEIPEVPVQDVQVNGVSILTDGVANVPLATQSNIGVVKVGDGLTIQSSTGKIFVDYANNSAVKAGTNTYRAITPGYQEKSTFYGLAKAAGADMASSSNPVGMYTDEAKVAIQKMLGIYEAPWELIREDTFTNETEADHIITVDGNGNSFELTDVRLLFELPKVDAVASKGYYGQIWFYYNATNRIVSEAGAFSRASTTDDARGCWYFVEYENGMVTTSSTSDTVTTNTTARKYRYVTYTANDSDEEMGMKIIPDFSINKINIKSVTGTGHYKLYGKRKW